ncbi:hypothetical protein X474_10835 [Dethiosulfatarculus sandiegensis]|uniref:Uncharacterized protein n=1 Tax=Dethiosulfatarculus sandiegensis TaxID=1429043 RepID=A0A0D2JWV7_9BACT|nr:hypothetical protein X474_10835 [Dethiosulfatarculus sandiegensis]
MVFQWCFFGFFVPLRVGVEIEKSGEVVVSFDENLMLT